MPRSRNDSCTAQHTADHTRSPTIYTTPGELETTGNAVAELTASLVDAANNAQPLPHAAVCA
jgi:hypothetical protein